MDFKGTDLKMKKKTRSIKTVCRLLFFAALVCLMPLTSCGDGQSNTTEIISASLKNNRETVLVEATLDAEYLKSYGDEKVYLLALGSEQAEGLRAQKVLDEAKASSKLKFKFKLGEDKVDAATPIVLARKTSSDSASVAVYAAISEKEYINNPNILSIDSDGAVSVHGIKGLSTQDISKASLLGADRVLIDVPINEYLLERYTDGAINHICGGVSYYFDGGKTEALDKRIKEAAELGLRVYLRTRLDFYGENTPREIYCPSVKEGALGYCVNTASDSAANYIRAFYDFLGSRYSDSEMLALDYIIGQGVNSYQKNCNAGIFDSDQFQESYSAWARIAHNILTAYNKNAKIYISVDRNLRLESGGIGSKVFLSSFAANAKRSGDYNWSVALDLGNGEDISELLSGDAPDYSKVGANNLSELSSHLDSKEMLYDGESRRVMIDSLSLPITLSERNRAAYYIYTYYKAAEAGFDAFFYNDSQKSSLYSADKSRGDLFYAFMVCGSQLNSQLKDYTDKIQNGSLPSFNDYTSRKLTYEQEVSLDVGKAAQKNKESFPAKLYSFKSGGSVYNVESANLRTLFSENKNILRIGSDLTSGSGYVSCTLKGSDIIESGYVGVTMSSSRQTKVLLLITSDSDKNAAYLGEATLNDSEKTYYFNITDLTKDLRSSDKLQMSLIIPSEDNGVGNLKITLTDIALFGSSGNGTSTIIAVVAVAFSVLAACGLLFWLTQRRKRRTYED